MKLEKNFLILFVGRVTQAVLALISIRVLTSLLSREDVGLTYLVASLASYFVLIFVSPIGMYLNRKIHSWFKQKVLFGVFRIVNFYFLSVGLLSIPFVLVGYYYLGIGQGLLPWHLCLLIFSNIYFVTWFQTLGPGLNLLEYRGAFVGVNLLAQLAGLLFSICGVLYLSRDAFTWMMGILLGQILGAILSWFYFRSVMGKAVNYTAKDLLFNKSVLYFCVPLATTTAFMWGQTQSFRVIVESNAGAEALAVLGVGFSIAVSISGLVESIVTQYFHPRYYSDISDGDEQIRIKTWKILFANALSVYLPTMLFVICCAKYLLNILVSSQFSDSLHLVIWGALIEFFRMVTNIIYIVSQSEMHTRSTIQPYGIGALFVISGIFLGFNKFPGEYQTFVPVILVLGGVLVCLSMYRNMKKILPIRIDYLFIGWCLIYSLPFFLVLFIPVVEISLPKSLLVCAVFGTYLLGIIWRLHMRIKQNI